MEEVRVRLREKLEGIVGAEETSYLMDRPPGGWSDLATNQTLTDKLDTLRHEMRAELAGVRTEVREGFAEVRAEFAAVRGEAAEARGSFDAKLSALSASVDDRLRRQTWVSTSTLITGLGLAFAIARFA